MKIEKSKNLIVIIGNGFDLAHNLKTTFNDFANYYLQTYILKNIPNVSIDSLNQFSNIFKTCFEDQNNFKNKLAYNNEEKEFINELIKSIKSNDEDRIIEILSNCEEWIFSFILSNHLLGKLYNSKKINWFDIEQSYFKELLRIYNDNYEIASIDRNTSKKVNSKLKKLNTDFKEIKNAFKDYLISNIKPQENKDIYNCFKEHFKERENITFINFNYTNTIDSYLRLKNDRDLNIKNIVNIHIHGNLLEDIVFGYGDDTDNNYKKMKDSKEKEYLRNFKTFLYLKSSNNRKLLNSLEVMKKYDVLTVGHSLDTTDKTVLKKILDSNDCNYIELLKRSDIGSEENEESHFELHANLSRIFDYETDLRDKLIPFSLSVNFPKMNNIDNKILNEERKTDLYLAKKQINIGPPSVY